MFINSRRLRRISNKANKLSREDVRQVLKVLLSESREGETEVWLSMKCYQEEELIRGLRKLGFTVEPNENPLDSYAKVSW